MGVLYVSVRRAARDGNPAPICVLCDHPDVELVRLVEEVDVDREGGHWVGRASGGELAEVASVLDIAGTGGDPPIEPEKIRR